MLRCFSLIAILTTTRDQTCPCRKILTILHSRQPTLRCMTFVWDSLFCIVMSYTCLRQRYSPSPIIVLITWSCTSNIWVVGTPINEFSYDTVWAMYWNHHFPSKYIRQPSFFFILDVISKWPSREVNLSSLFCVCNKDANIHINLNWTNKISCYQSLYQYEYVDI